MAGSATTIAQKIEDYFLSVAGSMIMCGPVKATAARRDRTPKRPEPRPQVPVPPPRTPKPQNAFRKPPH